MTPNEISVASSKLQLPALIAAAGDKAAWRLMVVTASMTMGLTGLFVPMFPNPLNCCRAHAATLPIAQPRRCTVGAAG
jgi:hypothetical protein